MSLDIKNIALSLKEIEIIKHSLGYDYRNYSFRNAFVTNPETEDGKICEGLVEKGLMTKSQSPNFVGESICYMCTDDCKVLIQRICGYIK